MKQLAIFGAMLLSVSMASANISIECGTGMDDNGNFEQTIVSASSEGWIEGTSGIDFDLEVNGAEIRGAAASGGSSSGITIARESNNGGLGPVGFVIDIDAWDDITTTGRLKTLGGFAGGLVQELECSVTEM